MTPMMCLRRKRTCLHAEDTNVLLVIMLPLKTTRKMTTWHTLGKLVFSNFASLFLSFYMTIVWFLLFLAFAGNIRMRCWKRWRIANRERMELLLVFAMGAKLRSVVLPFLICWCKSNTKLNACEVVPTYIPHWCSLCNYRCSHPLTLHTWVIVFGGWRAS